MGCQSSVFLGDNLVFSVPTHDPDTAALTDADTDPIYRIYSGIVAPPILTGTLTRLDIANTTAFYVAQIACTTANGFVSGGSYTIYIEATVDGVPGGITYGFTVETPIWGIIKNALAMPTILIKSMLLGQNLRLWRGDTLDDLPIPRLGDFTDVDDLWFTVKKQLSDEDENAELQISLLGGLLAIAGAPAATPANANITITDVLLGSITLYVEAEEMAKLDVDFVGYWDIQKRVGVKVSTVTHGNVSVLGDSTRRIV